MATEKESPKESQVRTFDRLSDKVNSSDFVNVLYDESAIDDYFKNKKVSAKELEQIKRYAALIGRGIERGDGSIKYTIDDNGIKGFTNTLGYNNVDEKGKIKDKVWGYAVSYATNKLNGLSAYKEPPAKPSGPSKIKYSDSAIGTAINRYIYGSDDGNLQDFLDLDKDTKTRANTNRAALFRKGLEHVRDNWDNLFEGWSEDLKTTALKNIEDAFSIFDNDNAITDDEYLTLRRATGMNNLRNMFANGEVASTDLSNPVSPTTRTYGDKIRWIERTYKPYTGKLRDPRSIAVPDTEVYEGASTNTLNTGITNASNDELYGLFREILAGTDSDNTTFIKKIFPNNKPRFSANYLINSALQALKGRTDGLYSFGGSTPDMYYIPTTKTTNNTGIVWDSVGNTLNEMSIHKIPYWVQRINSEWDSLEDNGEVLNTDLTTAYPNSYKQGGVLKAHFGTVMDRLGVHSRSNWLNIDNTNENAYNTNTWDNYYNNAGIDENVGYAALGFDPSKLVERTAPTNSANPLAISNVLNTTHLYRPAEANVTGPWSKGYLKDKDGNIIKDSEGNTQYGLSAAQLGILLNRLDLEGANLSWEKTLNAKGYEQWNKVFDLTGFNEYFGGDSGDTNHPHRMDYMGPSTYNRHAFIERLKGQYNSADNMLKVDGKGIYWNGRRWALEGMNAPALSLSIDVKPVVPDPSTIKINPVQLPDLKSFIGGTDPNTKKEGLSTGDRIAQAALELTPDLIGAGRLWASLRTNNRVASTILPSLNPVLKDTYERYSPITGAFSEMQFRDRQAADTLSLSYRPITSDASLAAARMLEGQRHANDLLYQGFIADDLAIRKSQAEALGRQEDNMARRSDTANFNRASINQTNRERAQLEATRLKSNWQSWDNFLSGVEQRMRTRFDENRDNRNAFELALASDNAADLQRRAAQNVQDEYNSWLTYTDANGNQPNKGKLISEWGGYEEAQRYIDRVRLMGNALQREVLARLYNSRYNDTEFNGNYELPAFRWSNPVSARNGAKLIPRPKKK